MKEDQFHLMLKLMRMQQKLDKLKEKKKNIYQDIWMSDERI